jgi:hypothetical protein
MDSLFRCGQATVAEVMEELPDPPSYCAVRAPLGSWTRRAERLIPRTDLDRSASPWCRGYGPSGCAEAAAAWNAAATGRARRRSPGCRARRGRPRRTAPNRTVPADARRRAQDRRARPDGCHPRTSARRSRPVVPTDDRAACFPAAQARRCGASALRHRWLEALEEGPHGRDGLLSLADRSAPGRIEADGGGHLRDLPRVRGRDRARTPLRRARGGALPGLRGLRPRVAVAPPQLPPFRAVRETSAQATLDPPTLAQAE